MKTITIEQVPATRRAALREYESDREYCGGAATDQLIQYVLNMSDEAYMNSYNEAARKQNRRTAVIEKKKLPLQQNESLLESQKKHIAPNTTG